MNSVNKYEYNIACAADMLAHKSDGTIVPLRDVPYEKVKFIGGRWRVQDEFSHKIQRVRDRDFVLGERLNFQGRMPFEYYRAYTIVENCYGKHLCDGYPMVVAKYETDNAIHWGYGRTIESARAFLGVRLFDVYMDAIHSVACKNKNNQK